MPVAPSGRAERAPWRHFARTPGNGPAAVRDLLSAIGLPEDVLGASHASVARVVGPAVASALLARDAQRDEAIERSLDWAESPGHHLIALIDPGYPQRLLQIADPPALLFVDGDPAVLGRQALAMVGSRSASRSGVETAEAFARAFGQAGLAIVSGLAAGIDAAAHRGALATAGGTLAVLGTGVDTVYPSQNLPLAQAIVAQGGALVAEVPLGTGPRKANFPRRNRLIAGLSLGVLVVEAALRSGSLITARLAAEFGREVFAIPGSIHSPLSKGCHQLIKQGARLVESAQDVLGELPAGGAPAPGTAPADRPPGEAPAPQVRGPEDPSRRAEPDDRSCRSEPGDPADVAVLAALGWDPASAETVAQRLAAGGAAPDAGGLAARLLELEMRGSVERLNDGRYQRRPIG